MTPKLTNEMRQALQEHLDTPLTVQDDQTQQLYAIVDEGTHQRAMKALQHQEDLAAINAGAEAAEQGYFAPLEEVDERIRKKLGFPPRA